MYILKVIQIKGQKMKKIELGITGHMVSHMSLGCMHMGSVLDKESSYKILNKYIELGGSFLDTADCYAWWLEAGNGEGNDSELLLGEWMRERNNRDEIFLATKVGAMPVDCEKAAVDFLANIEGLSRDAILTAFEKSLKNLQTDYVDLLYIHIDDRSVDLEETMGALNELVESGKVKYIGCSNMLPWRIEKARAICKKNSWAFFCCVQQSYTYLNPRPGSDFGVNEYVDHNLLDYVKENGDISILAYSPLMAGYYTRPEKRKNYWRKHLYENAGNETRLEALTKVAREHNVSENSVVFAWMLQKEITAMPIIAASKVEHLIENVKAGDLILSKKQIELLENS